jgi:hypothetical protein
MIFKLRSVNPDLWIRPFYFYKAAFSRAFSLISDLDIRQGAYIHLVLQ